jgi:hypothetical protein
MPGNSSKVKKHPLKKLNLHIFKKFCHPLPKYTIQNTAIKVQQLSGCCLLQAMEGKPKDQ